MDQQAHIHAHSCCTLVELFFACQTVSNKMQLQRLWPFSGLLEKRQTKFNPNTLQLDCVV